MAEVANLGPQRVITGLKPLILLVGVAAAIAAGVGVMLWSVGPTYSLLYSNLAGEDAAQIAQALDSARIPYKLEDGGGSISVPSEQIAAARLKLAAQGLPEGGGGVNAMTKDPGFGVSAFMESARYQHALETELARTIASLQNVQGARVHLAMPRQSAFVGDRKPGSASVFLQLKAGRRLDDEQVQSIANLVASSVPEMLASQVTVVDQAGRLLSAPNTDGDLAVRDKMFELAHRLEENYANRIQELLTPLVGPGRVRAQVVAQVEMSTTEQTREQYNPQSQVVRSESTSEEAAKNGAGNAGGVPGALTNQPPTPGVALPPGASPQVAQSGATPPGAAGAAATTPNNAASTQVNGPDSTSRQSTKNYEIDRTMAYTRSPAGTLKRLSVAVLIDNLRVTDKDGKTTETPLPQEQLDRLTALVKDAVGFDTARGDTVNLVNSSFLGTPPIEEGELESIPIWEKGWAQNLAKILAGVIVLLIIVFSVLKPLTKGLINAAKTPALRGGALAAASVAANGQALPPPEAPGIAYEQQVAQARGLVSQDPKRSAQVVKAWVSADE
ncbi:MAG TPA: flagellar basal-body MS-ring/collar protein FliF [Steroidobacteraceae bacterium]|nr:flagellar basal-body MS-ring/collar protein FliF [Steroidobacteraceae bacterium]